MAMPADLDALLASAAAHGISGTADRPCHDAADAMGRVLDAVEAAILPRMLQIEVNGAFALSLEVAGGRVLRVTGGALPDFDDLSDRGLTPEDAPRLGACLSAALTGARRLAIRPIPSEAGADTAAGIAAARIGAALGLAPYGSTLADRVADLLAAAEDVLMATVEVGGTVSDPRIPEGVAEFIARELNEPDGLAQSCRQGEAVFLELSDPPLGIGFLPTGDGPIALVFAAGALPDLAACWTETGGWGPVG